uniref:HP1078 n=1 Tax=Helicobacter pylori TaxID=210 RepID=B9U6A8_HELPX|nr:HP1078 [Helicobacter pylori]
MADKEILIFVEGPSDKVFLEVYLYFLEDFPIKNFKVKNIKGKDSLSNRLLEIEKYDKTLIIFDTDIKKENQESDAGFDNKLKHIYEKFQEKGIDFLKEQIFLFPNNQDDGDLETPLLEIAKHDEFLKCFEGYLECIKSKEHYKPIKNIRKNMLYAYLEALGLENLTKTNIGVFDDKGKIKEKHKEEYEKLKEAINFNSKSLIPLKDFLGQFAENKQKTKLKIF